LLFSDKNYCKIKVRTMLVCAQYLIKYGTNDRPIGLYHPLDGITNLKYKLLYFLTPNKKNSKRKALAFNWDRCCHLALCLRLILFHYPSTMSSQDCLSYKTFYRGCVCWFVNLSLKVASTLEGYPCSKMLDFSLSGRNKYILRDKKRHLTILFLSIFF